MSKRTLPVTLQQQEIRWGIRYLLFQLTFLGPLLSLALAVLGIQSTGLLLDTAYFIVNLGAVMWIFHGYLWHSFQYGLSHWLKMLIAACLGFAVCLALTQGLDWLIRWLRSDFYNVNDAGFVQYSRTNFLVTALGAVIMVPLAEETLFRGLIFGMLHPKHPVLAYVISAAFFAFVHVMGYLGAYPPLVLCLCFVQYLPAAFCLAWAYEYSGSILAPVLIHTAVNAIAILSMR